MKSLKITEDEALISFNDHFYDMDTIKETAQAFSETCWVNIDRKQEYIQVQLKPKKATDTKRISLEFCNYALGLLENADIKQ